YVLTSWAVGVTLSLWRDAERAIRGARDSYGGAHGVQSPPSSSKVLNAAPSRPWRLLTKCSRSGASFGRGSPDVLSAVRQAPDRRCQVLSELRDGSRPVSRDIPGHGNSSP